MSRERGSGSKRRVGVFLGPDDSLQLHANLDQKFADSEVFLEKCNTNCQLIASQADHLQRMRSRCRPAAQLTQQEIRNVEEKLIKLFSMQLLEKRRLPSHVSLPPDLLLIPSLRQWLEVVGLRKDVIEGLCQDISDLESLLMKSTTVIKSLLCKHNSNSMEGKKVFRSLDNLKRYIECQELNKNNVGSLYWDSWELASNLTNSSLSSSISASSPRPFPSGTSFLHSSEADIQDGGSSNYQRNNEDGNPSSPVPFPLFAPSSPGPGSHSNSSFSLSHAIGSAPERRYTPPPTPPINKGKSSGGRFPPTPPPSKKHLLQNTIKPQYQSPSQQSPLQPSQELGQPSLGRSTSHESQLWHRTDVESGNVLSADQLGSKRSRLHSDSGAETTMSSESSRSPVANITFGGDFKELRNHHGLGSCDFSETKISSPTRLPLPHDSGDEDCFKNTLNVPKNIMGSMGHNVHHIFVGTLKRKKCDFCHQKFPISGGLKCKACNYNSHRECKPQIPPSCGLPSELLEYFKTTLLDQSNQINNRAPVDTLPRGISTSQPAINHAFHTHDSSSNTSSCNSSSPSSPALILPPHSPAHHKPAFTYSDIRKLYTEIPFDMKPLDQFEPKIITPTCNNSTVDSHLSHESDKTVSISTTTSGSGSTGTDDSERTVAGRVDSQDSTVSESESYDPRCIRQNSVSSVSQSLREWDIPYDELLHEKVIGKGRFGIVYSGNWHGQVAIKEFHMDYVNDDKTLEAFKAEVSTFRKTRHENLVLFMGACMKPPRLAIVTSLCKGLTLYQHVHIRKDKFNMTRTIHIACQIAQGMGYLHARGIVHKDMKTKNIFLENGRVIITDFGLFNVTRLCYNNRCGDWFSIPPGWLCYLAPEIMRSLHFNPKHDDGLPFSTYSDVYAFGTVWYELLCGEWPYKSLPPEAVIWQVGRGIKPSLAHLQASREVKNLLMACCSYRPDERPQFSALFDVLEKLPKKRLARSPSHPVQLSRSAESVF